MVENFPNFQIEKIVIDIFWFLFSLLKHSLVYLTLFPVCAETFTVFICNCNLVLIRSSGCMMQTSMKPLRERYSTVKFNLMHINFIHDTCGSTSCRLHARLLDKSSLLFLIGHIFRFYFYPPRVFTDEDSVYIKLKFTFTNSNTIRLMENESLLSNAVKQLIDYRLIQHPRTFEKTIE